MVPMGATCVGSISLGFDRRIQTNKTSSWTNFFSLFNWNKDEEHRQIQQGLLHRFGFPSFAKNGNNNNSSDEDEKQNNNDSKNDNDDDENEHDNDSGADEDAAEDAAEEDEKDIEIEFVPPRSPLTSLSEYGQRKGKRTIYVPSRRPEMERGKELGWFNWGSAIILVTDLPDGYEPIVKAMQDLRVGQALVAPTGKATGIGKLASD